MTAPTVVLGGITAQRELSWWPGIVGPGQVLDPDARTLIGVDWQIEPGTTTHDQAQALLEELDRRCVDQVDVVGASYGGMVGLALAERAPERVRRLVTIAAAHRPHPLGTAWRSIQRRVLALARAAGQEREGVSLARMLAMTTYRSAKEFEARFAHPPAWVEGTVRAAVDSYLEHHGARMAERTTADAYEALCASVDLHWVEPEAVRVPVHVIGYRYDVLVPDAIVAELAERLPTVVSWTTLDSVQGHDGFLADPERLAPVLACALDGDA